LCGNAFRKIYEYDFVIIPLIFAKSNQYTKELAKNQNFRCVRLKGVQCLKEEIYFKNSGIAKPSHQLF